VCIRAGYSEKTAKQNGYENLTKPYLQDAISEGNLYQGGIILQR